MCDLSDEDRSLVSAPDPSGTRGVYSAVQINGGVGRHSHHVVGLDPYIETDLEGSPVDCEYIREFSHIVYFTNCSYVPRYILFGEVIQSSLVSGNSIVYQCNGLF